MNNFTGTQSVFKQINKLKVANGNKYNSNFFAISMKELCEEDAKAKELSIHKVIKELCIENDKDNPLQEKNEILKDWIFLKKYEKTTCEGCFICRTYKKHNTIVIVYKSVDDRYSITNVLNHFSKGFGLPHFKEAINYCKAIKKEFSNAKIYLSGYNLGGSAAQFSALYERSCEAVTFNALGVATIYNSLSPQLQFMNIVNYVSSETDKRLRSHHLGAVRLVFISDFFVMNIETNKQHQLNDFDNLQYYRSGCNSQA